MNVKFKVGLVAAFVSLLLVSDAMAQRGGRGRRGGNTADLGQQNKATQPNAGRQSGMTQGRFGGGIGQAKTLFSVLDKDSDGSISVKEMENAMQAFALLDENKDGKLTPGEAGSNAGGRGHSHGGGGGGRGQRGGQGMQNGQTQAVGGMGRRGGRRGGMGQQNSNNPDQPAARGGRGRRGMEPSNDSTNQPDARLRGPRGGDSTNGKSQQNNNGESTENLFGNSANKKSSGKKDKQ